MEIELIVLNFERVLLEFIYFLFLFSCVSDYYQYLYFLFKGDRYEVFYVVLYKNYVIMKRVMFIKLFRIVVELYSYRFVFKI